MSSHANILPKLARGQLRLKHLVNLLEGAVLDLREIEVDPNDGEETRRAPDPACAILLVICTEIERGVGSGRTVFGTPAQCVGVDEVGGREGCEPGACEADGGCETESVGAETLGGDFSTCEPGVCSYHTVVTADVDDGESNDSLYMHC